MWYIWHRAKGKGNEFSVNRTNSERKKGSRAIEDVEYHKEKTKAWPNDVGNELDTDDKPSNPKT